MEKRSVPRKVFVNPIYRDRATVLKTSKDTNGAYLLGELEVWPGGGNPMHTHSAFTETFTAIKGELGVMLNGKEHFLQPGQSMTVPRHTPHHFFNKGDAPVTCHVKLAPAHEDFIKGIAIGYGLAADGLSNNKGFPKNLTHAALLIDLTDTRPAGWMGFLFPVFKWVAKRARKKGVEKELLAKYYYE